MTLQQFLKKQSKHLPSMPKPKVYKLDISERLYALRILNTVKGDAVTLSAVLQDVRQLVVTDEEFTAAKRTETDLGDGNKQWQWENEGSEKDVTFEPETKDYLLKDITEKSEKKELTVEDKAALTLMDKLK
jgi:hypothetical protein